MEYEVERIWLKAERNIIEFMESICQLASAFFMQKNEMFSALTCFF
jgi:hypothetical protein